MCDGGGSCLKYLKDGGTEKKGGETKIFKKRGQVGSRGGSLKKRGLELPYELWMFLSRGGLRNMVVQM